MNRRTDGRRQKNLNVSNVITTFRVLTYVKHIASRIVKQSGASRDALWRADVASQSQQPSPTCLRVPTLRRRKKTRRARRRHRGGSAPSLSLARAALRQLCDPGTTTRLDNHEITIFLVKIVKKLNSLRLIKYKARKLNRYE